MLIMLFSFAGVAVLSAISICIKNSGYNVDLEESQQCYNSLVLEIFQLSILLENYRNQVCDNSPLLIMFQTTCAMIFYEEIITYSIE